MNGITMHINPTHPDYKALLSQSIDQYCDWRLVALDLAAMLDTDALAEFQKDTVEVEDSNPTRPLSVARINELQKARRAKQRRKDITVAQARVALLKAIAHPEFVKAHPEMLELGRYKSQKPFDHMDKVYNGGDKRAYNRRSFKAVANDGLEEYYAEEAEHKAEEAMRRAAEEADKNRMTEARKKTFAAMLDEQISADNAEMELVYLEDQIASIKHRQETHAVRYGLYKTVLSALESMEAISEDDMEVLVRFLEMIDLM